MCVAGDPEPRTIRVVFGGCGVSREYARGNPYYGMWFEEGGNGWGLGWWWSLLQDVDFYNERKVRKPGANISDVCATRGWENIDFTYVKKLGVGGEAVFLGELLHQCVPHTRLDSWTACCLSMRV